MATAHSDQFYRELGALRRKYPEVYIEAWTPEDFAIYAQPGEATVFDGDSMMHEAIANELMDTFDAELGTNWFRIEQAVRTVRAAQ